MVPTDVSCLEWLDALSTRCGRPEVDIRRRSSPASAAVLGGGAASAVDERLDDAGEAIRLFQVREVAGALEEHHLGAREDRVRPRRVADWDGPVAGAPDDEGPDLVRRRQAPVGERVDRLPAGVDDAAR